MRSNKSDGNLNTILQAQSKERLIELILGLASDSDLVDQHIRIALSTTDGDDELAECRAYIKSHIDEHSDRHGFVSYRNVGKAVIGAYEIAERAEKAQDNQDWVRAVRICVCILEEMMDLLQAADDSDGIIGDIITGSIYQIRDVAYAVQDLKGPDRTTIFRLLLQLSASDKFEGWSDWQLDLLHCAGLVATSPDLQVEWEQQAEKLTSEDDAGSSDYNAGRIAMMRYHFILERDGKDGADAFVKNHVHLTEFRRLAIAKAIDKGRFQEAIQLAEEGEIKDQQNGYPGRVKEWKQLRYKIYREADMSNEARQLALELLLDGEYDYYKPLKASYTTAEWPTIYENLVEQFESTGRYVDTYAEILVEERDKKRLLEHVKRQPLRIERYYRELMKAYPDEVKALFLEHIRRVASQADSRPHYREVCQIIRMLDKAGGAKEAKGIVRELVDTYARRPAFREELMKLISR